jgi:hypothetical protein
MEYEKQFHFRDGTAIASLDELKAKIESISYQEFYHHVSSGKNDFASWIRYVLKDGHLADDLEHVTSIVETVEILNDYLHPRPVTARRNDQQSMIEQDVFSHPMPAETSGSMSIEQVPDAMALPKMDKIELVYEPKIEAKAAEELFGRVPEQPKQQLLEPENHPLILKEFMYGLIFGLIIGLILGRLLS